MNLKDREKEGLSKGQDYVSISSECVIRLLEKPHLYHLGKDELYEINNEALEFLTQCDGSRQFDQLKPDLDFFNFCMGEGILELHAQPQARQLKPTEPVSLLSPSLRYLDLQITTRSNWQYRHCSLNLLGLQDIPAATIQQALSEFDQLQGLKLLISGGEPLLHPEIKQVMEVLNKVRIRKILKTNGALITPQIIPLMRGVQEVQIDLDGLKRGHEYCRGESTFDQAIEAIQLCRREGFEVSVATVLHRENLGEIEQLSDLLHKLGVREWGISVLKDNCAGVKERFFGLSPEQVAPYLKFAFGDSVHGGSEGFTCGRHLCTIMPDGSVCKCNLYAGSPVGHIKEGLSRCWARMAHIPLDQLNCRDCSHLQDCGGGCRKRAETEHGPDPIMCAFYQRGPECEKSNG